MTAIRLAVLAVFLCASFSPALADERNLQRCRAAVTRANANAAGCVGAQIASSIRSSSNREYDCAGELLNRYERVLSQTGADPVACGATSEHSASVIMQLEKSIDYVDSFTTGRFEILAQNLSSPRGLTCAPSGDSALVYVAEAGSGGTTESEFYIAADGRPAFVGNSGAVGRLNANLTYERVIEGLPSSAAADSGGGFLDANGPNDVAFFDNGEMAIIMGLASNANIRDTLTTPGSEKFGTVLTADGEILVDLADYERMNNSDGRLIPEACGFSSFVADKTSNPFRASGGETISVVDSGANAVLSVNELGKVKVLAANFLDQLQSMPDLSAFFPAGQALCPPSGPGLPPAGPLPAQSVPTGIACTAASEVCSAGPAGIGCEAREGEEICVVSELTGLPFAPGSANIYDISTSELEYPIVASGFTTLIDLAFGEGNALFALEYSRNGLPGIFGVSPAIGGLYALTPDGLRQQLDGRRLEAPNGVVVCDGDLYVTDRTRNAGEGRILRYRFD